MKLLFAALHESGFPIVFCCALLSGAMSISVAAENAPGVTDSEIKIGLYDCAKRMIKMLRSRSSK